MAFIRANQATVLGDSIGSLESSSLEDLPRVVHAIHGSLGSYQLHSAHEHIVALARLLADPTTSPEAARAAQLQVADVLRAQLPALLTASENPA